MTIQNTVLTTLDAGTILHASRDGAWWRNAVIYQVYPRSFADADGDGIGDLAGITSHLDHLAALGVDALWLSPFYRSPQKDAGYDVADYRDIDPLFGTLTDFDDLLAAAHARRLRVIVDIVPNHTSDQHAWFRAALASPEGSPERARYIFRPGRGEHGQTPPNNWQSVFGGPAWTRVPAGARPAKDSANDFDDAADGEWYLHLFDPSQPDLDWTNPEVHAEFESVLRFWLDRGVDGFRVDVAHGMVKAEGLPDWDGAVAMVDGSEPAGPAAGETPGDTAAFDQPASPMFDQDDVHRIYRSWRRVLDAYTPERAMVAEAWVEPPARLARYVRPDEMHQAFNFAFLTTTWDAGSIRAVIESSLAANDAVDAPTTWVLSNHDVVRHATRLGLAEPNARPNGVFATDPQPDATRGLARARAATLLMLALPGSAYLYQGEELGLPDHTSLPDDVRQDPAFERTGRAEAGRDGCRIPLPWEADAPGFGFSPTGRTWLPQPAAYRSLAVDAQRGVAGSTYEMYRAALAIRREYRLGAGSLGWVDAYAGSDDVVALRNGDIVALLNLGTDAFPLPDDARVLVASGPLEVSAGAAGDRRTAVPVDTAVWVAP